jgi:hypothetical protein
VPVVSPAVFSAIVVTVIATTVFTPPALAWSFGLSSRVDGPHTKKSDAQELRT